MWLFNVVLVQNGKQIESHCFATERFNLVTFFFPSPLVGLVKIPVLISYHSKYFVKRDQLRRGKDVVMV